MEFIWTASTGQATSEHTMLLVPGVAQSLPVAYSASHTGKWHQRHQSFTLPPLLCSQPALTPRPQSRCLLLLLLFNRGNCLTFHRTCLEEVLQCCLRDQNPLWALEQLRSSSAESDASICPPPAFPSSWISIPSTFGPCARGAL